MQITTNTNRTKDIQFCSNSFFVADVACKFQVREMLQWMQQIKQIPRKCNKKILLFDVETTKKKLYSILSRVEHDLFFALSGRNSSIWYLQIDLVIIVTFRIVLIDCNVLKCNSHTNTNSVQIEKYMYAMSRTYRDFFFTFFFSKETRKTSTQHTHTHTYMHTSSNSIIVHLKH